MLYYYFERILCILLIYIPIVHTNYKLGILIPYNSTAVKGFTFVGAVPLVVDEINNRNKTIANGSVVTYLIKDSKCDDVAGLGSAVDLIEEGVDVIIGPACSSACLSAGKISTYKKVPMISYSCSSIDLSDKKKYPYFSRTKPYAKSSMQWTPKVFVEYMKYHGWKKACLIERESDIYIPLARETKNYFKKSNIKLLHVQNYVSEGKSFSDFGKILKQLRNKCRIIFMSTRPADVTQFLIQAKINNMLKGYAYITIDYYIRDDWPFQLWNLPMNSSEKAIEFLKSEILNGMTFISANGPSFGDIAYEEFSNATKNRIMNEKIMGKIYSGDGNFVPSQNIAYIYDAIWLYTKAAKNLANQGKNFKHAALLTNALQNTVVQGYTGEVHLDELGNRIPNFTISNYQHGKLVPITYYNPLSDFFISPGQEIVYPGGSNKRPLDEPKCGFLGDKCPKKRGFVYTTLYIAMPLVLLILAVVIIYVHNKRKYEASLLCKDIIVEPGDLTILGDCFSESVVSTTFNSFPQTTSSKSNHGETSEVVICRTKKCCMKTIKKCKLELTADVLIQLRKIKELNHANVNMFVGISLDEQNVSFIWEYCTKGTLWDVLHVSEFDCDWMFRKSFAYDIAKGLAEIHNSSVGVHGNLSSKTCVIDNRWVCKLSDFGLEKLKEVDEDEMPRQRSEDKLWTAPEFLQDPYKTCSRSADVYSFAIILYEIGSKEKPYAVEMHQQNLTAKQVVNRVRQNESPPFRPKMTSNGVGDLFVHLMSRCWQTDPLLRPTTKEISHIIKKMDKDRYKGGLIDHMITLMERYSTNLEEIVSERTNQLHEERQKTENLLYKMLPISIAKTLKQGEVVNPEHYDCVTVFFSDIVHFTDLCTASEPKDIINMLNDLYTCFDQCLCQYNVYKVEAIGDAYMVASGLPIRNGNQHAAEIAFMSLDLMLLAGKFRIKHRPSDKLQLRIGIHSGPTVGGLVGLTIPKYCLFGETITYASRMESSSLPYHIHVSQTTKTLLDTFNRFYLNERNEFLLEGLSTYFLKGQKEVTHLPLMTSFIQNTAESEL